jgi:histidine ammonia-lyase
MDRPISEKPRRAIGFESLTVSECRAISRGEVSLSLDARAEPAIEASNRQLRSAIRDAVPIYGVTTGFGALANKPIPASAAADLQVNLLRSHACGVGPPLPDSSVRLMLALRAHALARGYSGIRRELIQALLDAYNAGIIPVVPSQGSVGASGDLAPLAHLALPLIGDGHVRLDGRSAPAREALDVAGIEPLTLEPKEALALINGTQLMTAVACLSWLDAERVLTAAEAAGALTVVALDGRLSAFDAGIQDARPHPGQRRTARNLRAWLEGRHEPERSDRPVQDRYSLRALPQVIGAVRDAHRVTGEVLEVEINAATDNPLFFPNRDEIISGANFHGHPVALACDSLKTAMASLGVFSERRTFSLVDPRASGLPAFLAPEPGLHSGLMLAQYVAAALASENKTLAHPASVDSIPTSADVEDYNSMGSIAARQLRAIVDNTARIVAIELLCAAQAIELRGDASVPPRLNNVVRAVRERVPFVDRDGPPLDEFIEELTGMILEGIEPPGSGRVAS